MFSTLRQLAHEIHEHMSEKGWFLFTLWCEAAFKGASLTAHISHLCTDMRVCRTHMRVCVEHTCAHTHFALEIGFSRRGRSESLIQYFLPTLFPAAAIVKPRCLR